MCLGRGAGHLPVHAGSVPDDVRAAALDHPAVRRVLHGRGEQPVLQEPFTYSRGAHFPPSYNRFTKNVYLLTRKVHYYQTFEYHIRKIGEKIIAIFIGS